MHTLQRKDWVLSTIPSLRPGSKGYIDFWKTEKRKCIEGVWVNGVWCPPQLYFYLNFWHIKVAVSVYSKAKKILKPFFRVVEWEMMYHYTEAIGFSGFEEDEEYTCHRAVRDFKDGDTLHEVIRPSCTRKDGSLKKYIPARKYLRMTRDKGLGKPLYLNTNLNFVDLQSRGTGKSYRASCLIAHNWLFDGYTDYDAYFQDQRNGEIQASETLVGAIDTFYSKALLNKVQEGLKYLPGKYESSEGRVTPPPFSKKYTGSFEPGEAAISRYKSKKAGMTEWKGSGSQILHRSFNDNPLAGNGSRPGRAFLEEVGFFGNLLESLGALKDCMSESGVLIGTIYMMGTGGDMTGGATEQVQAVFYDPEQYNCVVFQDEYENSPKSQGFFLPFYKADNEFLDKETGLIDEAKSIAKCLRERERLKNGKDTTAYSKELENRPLVPSEVFLITNSNKFPIAQLKEQLGLVQTSTESHVKGKLGWIVRDGEGKLTFKPDLTGELRMPGYPIRRGDNDNQKSRDVETEGATHIWEHPKPGLSYGHYASGLDPYEKEEALNSISIGSLFVIERGCLENGGYDRIVAEYTGRPDSGTTEFYTNCMNLIEYYNSHECLYESNVNQFKGFLENRHKLHLLAFTPGVISNRVKDSNSSYGVYVGNKKVKNELLQHGDDFLRKQVNGQGKLQLQYIYSEGLLKELIAYNDDGNFDRVIAFCCAVTQSVQLETVELTPQKEQAPSVFAGRKFFTNHTSGYSPRSPSPQMRKPQHTFLPPNGR
ncbi:hypothetical protein Q5H92_14700 [Hymenobacter sp. M29]|uniref:Terminase n=1 Tax=Hymenobacter mellowenesis TaxID=3063995 RepID=A0ABT9ACQ6_9BACT|nr:hypothetical protein [Hymenobacter sp. M29]MDO7847615.1 hypothetical protein [Hymenobacter sp. M29]